MKKEIYWMTSLILMGCGRDSFWRGMGMIIAIMYIVIELLEFLIKIYETKEK